LEPSGLATRGAHGADDQIGAVPDVELADLEHRPPRSTEPRDTDLVSAPIGAGRVEQLALDLDDDPQGRIDEVHPSNPTIVVAQVDLLLESRFAGVSEDRREAVLDAALRRPVMGAASEGQAPQRGGAAGASPPGQLRGVLVELVHPEEPLGEHPLAEQVESIAVEPSRQIAQRAQR
jgi:hypothetical protein